MVTRKSWTMGLGYGFSVSIRDGSLAIHLPEIELGIFRVISKASGNRYVKARF